MPMYSVKIGEINLTSDRPITEADRKNALQSLSARQEFSGSPVLSLDGGEVVLRLNQETVYLTRR